MTGWPVGEDIVPSKSCTEKSKPSSKYHPKMAEIPIPMIIPMLPDMAAFRVSSVICTWLNMTVSVPTEAYMSACIESFVIYEIALVSNLPSLEPFDQTHPLAYTTHGVGHPVYHSLTLALPAPSISRDHIRCYLNCIECGGSILTPIIAT